MAKEIVFTAKNKFELLDYQDNSLGKSEVRGPTLTTLISPGTELAWAGGDNFPLRPGYAAVFEASELGEDVNGITKGDHLLCMGNHRSTQQFDARYTLKVPYGLDPSTAVIARLMGVSMTTLMTTQAKVGDMVIVTGAGPIGYLAAHQCKIAGFDVMVVEPNATRRGYIEQSGIRRTISALPLHDPAVVGKVAMVIDCSGHEGAVLDACKVVRKRGEVVLVGVPWAPHTDIRAHELLNAIFFNYVVLRSGWEWEVPILSRDFAWEELYEGYNNAPYSTFSGLSRALNWLSNDLIPLEGLMASVSPKDPEGIYTKLVRREVEEPFIVLDWRTHFY